MDSQKGNQVAGQQAKMAASFSCGATVGFLACLVVMICIAVLQYDYEIRSFNTIDRTALRWVRDDADVIDSSVEWDCNRPWPSNAIFLTLYVVPRGVNVINRHHWETGNLPEWYDIFLRGK
ncbi:hypothetical protein EON65_23920 [archaeon]|nr:MAG: hypothetical protein EON65_23920 [archaeon]